MKLGGNLTMGTESGPIWLGIRLSSSKSPADYSLLVYQKGAYVLHMLRMMMKDFQNNSDEGFFEMMKDFVKTYSWKNATTKGFQEIAEKHYGQKLQWFFDQWVYGTRVPKYEFRWKVESAEGNKHFLICDIQQRNVPDGFQMPVPVYLDFGKDRFAIQRILVDEPVKTVRLPLPEKPRNVQFNFQRAVLCYD
jgi:aminopeptidase N